jgi:hypothetical protein
MLLLHLPVECCLDKLKIAKAGFSVVEIMNLTDLLKIKIE